MDALASKLEGMTHINDSYVESAVDLPHYRNPEPAVLLSEVTGKDRCV